MSETPTLVEAVDDYVEASIRRLYVGGPARVESYDRTKQRANIQPLILEARTDLGGRRVAERLPVLQNVPVVFSAVLFDLVPGDTVWYSIAHSAIRQWLNGDGRIVDPVDDRHHNINDAVCFPYLRPFSEASDQAAEGAHVLPGNDIRLGSVDASQALALKQELDDLKTAITNAATGASDGGAAFKANLLTNLAGWPVGTTKVKAE